jgi:hypothetical protein
MQLLRVLVVKFKVLIAGMHFIGLFFSYLQPVWGQFYKKYSIRGAWLG